MFVLALENGSRYKKSEILRKNIYHSAVELFKEKGFENVKIAHICEALKISTGTFYYYFPSKEAIFLEYASVADDLMDELSGTIDYANQSERLKKLVMQKVHMFSVVGQKMSNTCLSAFLKHNDDSYMDLSRTAYSQFKDAIDAGIASGEFIPTLDSDAFTSQLRYLVCGITLHWASSPQPFDIDKTVEEHLDFIIQTIKAK